uniref:Uncharacterized protein n=1 Tax=Strigamia maritima TaxID=126957 RepID=T1J963_STRMM
MSRFTCMNQLLYVMDSVENVNVGRLWKLTNTANIITSAVLKRLNNITTVTPKKMTGPMGICSGSLEFPSLGSAHEPGEHAPDIRNLFGFTPLQIIYITLVYKQYIFLNSTKNPCVDHTTYNKCQDKCLLKMYTKQKFPCRFPFMPSELNLDLCITKKDVTKNLYIKAITTYITTNPIEDCNCLRRCNKIAFEFSLTNNAMHQNETTFHLFLRNKQVLSVEERHAFHFISLLSDFGGNLGLYFGLSVLSAVYYVQQYIECIKALAKVKRIQRKHPKAYHYVAAIFDREMKKREKNVFSKHTFQGYPHCFVSVFLLIVTIYLLTSRIIFYISEPTRVVINVVENSTMHFPSLTLCGESRNFTKVRKAYARKEKTKEFCKDDFWDFFDKNVTAQEVWAFQDITGAIFNETESFAKKYVGLVPLRAEQQSVINTPTGQCSHFKIGKHTYAGTATMFALQLLQQQRCQSEVIAYVTANDLEPNIIYHTPVIASGNAAILFTAKKVTYHESYKNPCVSPDSTLNCERRCLQRKLKKQLQCRLPYLKNIRRPVCNSSKSAILSDTTFKHVFVDKKSCNCTKPCTTLIIDVNWYFEPHDNQLVTMYVTIFIHNTIEYINELPHYTYVQLMCDIGSILSVTLGLCIPVICLTLQNIAISTCWKVVTPFK